MPVCYPQCAGKPYRPSNGTEGELFHEQFCYRCIHDQDDEEPCEIHTSALACDLGDADYPKEWVYDREGRPACTAFHDVQSDQPAATARCPNTPDMFT